DWLPSLALRLSSGLSGNSGNSSAYTTIIYTTYILTITEGFPQGSIAQMKAYGNPDLRWEQVSTTNVGLDFSLIKKLFSGSIDFYRKKSTDVLSQIPFDLTTGVNVFLVNSASLKGSGFELLLRSVNTTGALSWTTNFSLSHARSIV